jgi:hypothetical protein
MTGNSRASRAAVMRRTALPFVHPQLDSTEFEQGRKRLFEVQAPVLDFTEIPEQTSEQLALRAEQQLQAGEQLVVR